MSKADRPDHPQSSERFNEEQATYAVRGSDQPDLEKGVAAIREVLKTLPRRPGVYRMQDARGDVLYVGKARALRNRVTNYTQVAKLPKRLQRMVAQTRSMTIVTTRTEAEALLLEAQLIKRFRPPYNVLLRDDKSFPFILLREDHEFPRIQKHRGARRIKGQYYGPFASAGSVTRTLNALQKLFLLRSCSDSYFENRSRPCLLYQIKRCSAPCVGRIGEDEYAELVGEAKEFLAGRSTGVQSRLSRQMADAADKQDYELAAVYRDRLRALTYIQGSQTVHAEGLGDADVFALACKAGTVSIQAFFIRGGQNWGHRAFFPAHVNDVPEAEVLSSFLVQFYEDMPPPKRILVDRDLVDRELLEVALSERAGRRIAIEIPRRGSRRKLMDQAKRNAEEALDRRLAETTTQGKILRVLVEQTFQRVGGTTRVQVDARVVSSTTADLRIEISEGRFREDLYHRLNVVPIRSPSLSERRDDIPLLVTHFMKRLSATSGLPVREIGEDAMAVLQAHSWPGNVRQLRNIVERLLILATDDAAQVISADLLPSELSGNGALNNGGRGDLVISLPLREAREIFERDYLLAQINRFGGNISRTASFIGMERSALHRKLKSLGVGPTGREQIFNA